MVNRKDIDILKSLSIKKLKEQVKEIKSQLPKEEQNTISYSKNFTLSLSNYCENHCGYCFFNHRVPKLNGESNVSLLDDNKMESLIENALHYKCKEALLMSGEHPDNFQVVRDEMEKRNCNDFIEFVKRTCIHLLESNILPHTNIGMLTYDEMKLLKNYNASMGLMLESTSVELFKKGGVHELSPGKLPEKRLKHIKNAGKLKIPFTTGLLVGIGETIEDRIKDMYLIKQIHEEFGHVQEVIIQNFVEKEGINYHPKIQISIEDMLKMTGIARIIFKNDIAIQVPPNLIAGNENDFIDLGIDDFGGISPFTMDYINPKKLWPQIEYLHEICQNKGFKLKERLPIYEKFISSKEFCTKIIKKVIDNIN